MKTKINLWLDDIRPAPEGYVWAKTYDDAVLAMLNHDVVLMSLDHDLGFAAESDAWHDAVTKGYAVADPDLLTYDNDAKEGYDFCLWMAEHDRWPSQLPVVHSWNPGGAARMVGVIDRYGPYNAPCRHIPAKEFTTYVPTPKDISAVNETLNDDR